MAQRVISLCLVERPDVLVTTTSTHCLLTDWQLAGLRAESCFRAYVLTAHLSRLTVIGHLSDRDWTPGEVLRARRVRGLKQRRWHEWSRPGADYFVSRFRAGSRRLPMAGCGRTGQLDATATIHPNGLRRLAFRDNSAQFRPRRNVFISRRTSASSFWNM